MHKKRSLKDPWTIHKAGKNLSGAKSSAFGRGKKLHVTSLRLPRHGRVWWCWWQRYGRGTRKIQGQVSQKSAPLALLQKRVKRTSCRPENAFPAAVEALSTEVCCEKMDTLSCFAAWEVLSSTIILSYFILLYTVHTCARGATASCNEASMLCHFCNSNIDMWLTCSLSDLIESSKDVKAIVRTQLNESLTWLCVIEGPCHVHGGRHLQRMMVGEPGGMPILGGSE